MVDGTQAQLVRPWVWSPAPACFPVGKAVRGQCDPGQSALGWESKAGIDLFITSRLCDLGQVGVISGLSSSRKDEIHGSLRPSQFEHSVLS